MTIPQHKDSTDPGVADAFFLCVRSFSTLRNRCDRRHQADADEVERAITQCLREAERRGITGNKITPFILQGVKDLTKGKSLEANIKLVKNNALVGAQIATQLAAPFKSKL